MPDPGMDIGRPVDWYEPPAPPECLWCDGSGAVEISSITDCTGTRRSLRDWETVPDIACPLCAGTQTSKSH